MGKIARLLRGKLEDLILAGVTAIPRAVSKLSSDQSSEGPVSLNDAASPAVSTAARSASDTTELKPKQEGRLAGGVSGAQVVSDLFSLSQHPTGDRTTPMPCTPGDRIKALQQLAERVAQCTRCRELVMNRTQTVFGVGNPHSTLVFVGEAPGADEDRQGFPFVGRAGQLLTDIIVKGMGMRREDVYICNVIKCRPPGNRTPQPSEVAACAEYLDEQLRLIAPQFICCLGSVAAQRILDSKLPMSRLRGKVYEKLFHWGAAKVICTFHPAYLLRNPEAKRDTWEDIKLLLREMGREPPSQKR